MYRRPKKPYIRISRMRGCFICTGLTVIGSGDTMREAWESWKTGMISTGRQKLIPGIQAQ